MLVKNLTQLAHRSVMKTVVRNEHIDQLGLAGKASGY